MALSFIRQPLPYYLAGNPVTFELASSSREAIRFDVIREGETVYTGTFVPTGVEPGLAARISIQDVLLPLFEPAKIVDGSAIVSEMAGMFLDFEVTFMQGDGTLTHAARLYQGGVSKRMLRMLEDVSTDIFTWKLLNACRQFFMTTRTAGSRIVIRKNELAPLCFIATGKTHTVTTENGGSYTFPALEPGRVYAFNIEAFRDSLPQKPYTLTIPLFLEKVITVRIMPPAIAPDRFVIEFRNSYAVPERLEVSGKCVYMPAFEKDESFNTYDPTVDDYVERNNRTGLREIIEAEFGYKTAAEFFLARDLLQSDRRFLIDQEGVRREVRVSAESFAHDVFQKCTNRDCTVAVSKPPLSLKKKLIGNINLFGTVVFGQIISDNIIMCAYHNLYP